MIKALYNSTGSLYSPSVGSVGSTKNDGIKYSINGNIIAGSYAGKLIKVFQT